MIAFWQNGFWQRGFWGEHFWLGMRLQPMYDVHDGERDRRFARERAKKEELRRTIQEAIYGPSVADPVIPLEQLALTINADKDKLEAYSLKKALRQFQDDEESIVLLMQ